MPGPSRHELLSRPIDPVDVTSFDARPLIAACRGMASRARHLARAADDYASMLADRQCTVVATLSGSLVAAGLKKALITLVEHDMVDVVVSGGANAVDQDFFQALGFRHYLPAPPRSFDEARLRELAIERAGEVWIDANELRRCDQATREVFDVLAPGVCSSRQLVGALGAWLDRHLPDAESLILAAWRKRVPVFVPDFGDCSGGRGLVLHQSERADPNQRVTLDAARDFRELAELVASCERIGFLTLGSGAPARFVQDVLTVADVLGHVVATPRYAVRLAGSDLTTTLPLLASDAWHRGAWRERAGRALAEHLELMAPA